MTQEEAMLAQQQALIRQEKRAVMANAFVQPQQRFADIQTQAPNLRSGLLADDAYATAVSQNVGNVNINPYLTKIGLDFEEIDNEYNAYQNLYRNVNRLKVDEDQVNKALEGYKIGDNVTQNRFALQEVKSKAQRFRNDYNSNRSVIGAARAAYAARAAAEEDLMKAVEKGDEKGGINIQTARALLAEYDAQYNDNNGILGLNEDGTPKTEVTDNMYQTYNYGKYAAYADADKIMNEALKGFNYQGKSYSVADATPIDRGDGGIWVRATSSSGTEEYIPYAEVQDLLQTTLQDNPFYQDWIKQDAMLKSRGMNAAQIANIQSQDYEQEAYLIAQRAGLQFDTEGNAIGATNETSSLSGQEAVYRYNQLRQQANAFGGAVQTYQELIQQGATEEQAREISGLPEMSREDIQQALMEDNIRGAVRKGTNKTAFSRTESQKDASESFHNISAAGLAKAELAQFNQKQTIAVLANNPDMIEAEAVPDLSSENFFGGGDVPSNFMDYLAAQKVDKVGNNLLEEAVAQGTDGQGNYANQELNKLYQDYRKMNLEKDPAARVKYYIKTDKAQKTFGKGTLEGIYESLEKSGLKGKELAEQFTIKSNQMLQAMKTRQVGITSFMGSPLQKTAQDWYLGEGDRLGLAFKQGNVFYEQKGTTSKEQDIRTIAENAGYTFANDEEWVKFKNQVTFDGLTDGSDIGTGGYAISFKAKKDTDKYKAGETVTLFSKTSSVERDAANMNLHKKTSGLYNFNTNVGDVVFEKNDKGQEQALYANFANLWQTPDGKGGMMPSNVPLNSSSTFVARYAEPTVIATGKELEKYKDENGKIDYAKLAEATKNEKVKQGLITADQMGKIYIANPKHNKSDPNSQAFIKLGDLNTNWANSEKAKTNAINPTQNPGSSQGTLQGDSKVAYRK